MHTKKLAIIIMLVTASLAYSLFRGVIPEAQAGGDQAVVESPAQVESAPGAEAPQTIAEAQPAEDLFYPIVDTGQFYCYSAGGGSPCPTEGQSFYGQDAQYSGNAPSYTDNDDGTISDNVTGLMWQGDPGAKMTYTQAAAGAESFDADWRLPTIKELYSLILFSGQDPSGWDGTDTSELVPFIDDVFAFEYGDTSSGERIIDSQFATSTKYVNTTMKDNETDFGVNFADGRIKGYPTGPMPGQSGGKLFFVLYVRGSNAAYVSFDRALGYMNGQWLDVHGAGAAQRPQERRPG